jgi:hypothetical protein
VRFRRTPEGIELSANPFLRRLLLSRWPQWFLTVLALAGFLYAILAGLFGTPVGNRNLAITAVWIAWWAVLILILVPLGGRAWCSICPIPAAGDWLQRGGLTNADGRRSRGKGLRWPRRLRNLWPQNVGFLLLGITSTVILTTPLVSALVLAGLLGIALIVSAIFERRTFCRYLCPVGGFIGMYSLAAPLALRVKDPGTLNRNAACGLCMECLRTCPLDNVALVLKSPASDLTSSGRKPPLRLDESFKAFIMLGAALIYSAVLFGPWAAWKQAAYDVGGLPWFGYALAFTGFVLLVIPALYAATAWLGRRAARIESIAWRNFFLRSTSGLVPLGLAAWVAFSLSLVFINGSYVLATLSDPLGLNWNLFGTAAVSWQPLLSGLLPGLQVTVLMIGLAWSTSVTIRAISHAVSTRGSRLLASLPTIGANMAIILILGWLYL